MSAFREALATELALSRAQARFGTIAGQHTKDELADLLAAKDHDLGELDRIQKAFLPTWSASDTAAASDWTTDYLALQKRYALAHAKAETAMSAIVQVTPGAGLVATESGWQGVIHALKQAGDPGPITKGDLQDLATRLQDAGAKLDMGPTVQPSAKDADLGLLHSLATVDVAGVLTGENKDPTARKIAIGLGIAAGLALLYGVYRVYSTAKR